MATPDIPARPGISRTTLIAAGVRHNDGSPDCPELGSLWIPYHTYEGDEMAHGRWRLVTTQTDGKKYHQKRGSKVYPYLPPAFFHRDREKELALGMAPNSLVLEEGEFKMLSLLEEGIYAIGLPGLNVYTNTEDENGNKHRQLLPDLESIFDKEKIEVIYLLGDSDTYANFAFARNAAFLASAAFPAKVFLPRIPLNGPGKGIDDIKEALGAKFGLFFSRLIKEAIELPKKCDPSLVAQLILEREETALEALSGAERGTQRGRITKLCAEAQLSNKSGISPAITDLHNSARKILEFSLKEFKDAVAFEIAQLRTNSSNGQKALATDPKESKEANRPRVCLGRVESKFAAEIGKVLGPLGVVFRCDDRVVEIQKEEFTGELDRFKLARGGPKFNTMTPARMRTWVEQFVETGMEIESESGESMFIAKTMSETCARSLLVSPQFLEHIPRIDRILDVPIPIRTPDGKIIFPEPGFNPSLGIYCAPNALEIKIMPVEEAKKVLDQALLGFCWKIDDKKNEEPAKIPQSKVHAIARILTPYARGIMGFSERIPLWYFVGNRPRCGKDYLNGVTQIVYLGHAFEDAPITDNYEETGKRIVSALRAGRRMMHFANCQHHLNDPAFIQSITAPIINARSLGSNDAKSDLELANEIDYSISANVGLTYREDVEPRLRKIELEFFEEDANKRTFPNPHLHDWIKENRSRILSAIHSLFQHWISEGVPAGKTLFNSYPRWAEVVGGVMITCGLGDPCLPHEGEDLLGGDLKEIAMRALYQAAFESFPNPNDWIQKGDIYDLIREHRENNDRLNWFGDLDGDPKEKSTATKRIGNALSSFQGRILGGIKMMIDTSTAKSQQWRYRFTKVF